MKGQARHLEMEAAEPGPSPPSPKASGLWHDLHHVQARRRGGAARTLVDYRGAAAGATRANVFFVRTARFPTPTEPDRFLNGITRQTVMDLLRQRGIRRQRAAYRAARDGGFPAMLADRHRGRVTPVGAIGPHSFEVGELTRAIAGDYEKLVRSQLVAA